MIISDEIQVKRYAAFYRGWCQAFGNYLDDIEESAELQWIYGEEAIGLVMPGDLQKRLMRQLVGRQKEPSRIILAPERLQVGDESFYLESEADMEGLNRIRALLSSGLLVHMYMTSHFYFPSGTRIITFSTRKPLPIMYREIPPLQIQLKE